MRTALLPSAAMLACLLAGIGAVSAQTAVPSPTPAEPGRSATEGVTSDTTPPAKIDPAPPPAGSPPVGTPPPGAPATAIGGMSPAEIRELLAAVQATAKATREAVDYSRVTPDILTQILAKLDKIEDKLDKVENAIRAGGVPRRR